MFIDIYDYFLLYQLNAPEYISKVLQVNQVLLSRLVALEQGEHKEYKRPIRSPHAHTYTCISINCKLIKIRVVACVDPQTTMTGVENTMRLAE